MRAFLSTNRSLSLLLLAFVALALFYSSIIPLFEGPDEDDHFRFAKSIADHRALPVQRFEAGGGEAGHQGWQPPLYYALAAILIAPIDTSDYSEHLYRNYAATPVGDPACCGRNLYYHFANEDFPYTRTTLAVHLARLLSILFGAITVAATYALAKSAVETAPTQTQSRPFTSFRADTPSAHLPTNQPTQVGFAMLLPRLESPHLLALTAASLVAFNPTFLFVSALVSNDAALAAFSSLVLLMWVKLLRGQIALNAKSAAMLGALIGLSVLVKTTALGLFPLTGLLFAFLLFQRYRGNWQGWLRDTAVRFLLFAFCFSLFSAWWFARNWLLYGDPLASRLMQVSALFPRAGELTLAELFNINLPWFWQTFWGGPIPGDFPVPLLVVLGVLALLALTGLARTLFRISDFGFRTCILVLGAWLAVILLAQVQFIRMTVGADQGRYLFPAISTFALFFALGAKGISDTCPCGRCKGFGVRISEQLSRNTQHASRITNYQLPITHLSLAHWLIGSFLALALAVPFTLVLPAYARPPLLSNDELARAPNATAINFANLIELRGYEIATRAVKAGETLDVTLYWRALARMNESYRVFVQLVGAEDRVVASADVIPARGAFPTLYWRAGDALRDVVRVPVRADAPSGQYALHVGLYPLGKPRERLEFGTGESSAIIGAVQVEGR